MRTSEERMWKSAFLYIEILYIAVTNERQRKCLESISDIYAVYIVRTLFSFVITIQ